MNRPTIKPFSFSFCLIAHKASTQNTLVIHEVPNSGNSQLNSDFLKPCSPGPTITETSKQKQVNKYPNHENNFS